LALPDRSGRAFFCSCEKEALSKTKIFPNNPSTSNPISLYKEKKTMFVVAAIIGLSPLGAKVAETFQSVTAAI
jgi:hypothetical protein